MRDALLLLAAPAGAQTVAASALPANVRPVQALRGDAARGKAGYKACVICHRADASGHAGALIPRYVRVVRIFALAAEWRPK